MNNDENLNILLFLGAGASACAGYSTFESFPDLVFSGNLRKEESLPPVHEATLKILSEIKLNLEMNQVPATHDNFLWRLNDYKRLWEIMRTDDVLRSRFLADTKLWGEFSFFSQVNEDAITDITHTTIKHYSSYRIEDLRKKSEKMEMIGRIIHFYQHLALCNSSQGPFLPVFTTNYDVFLEDLFQSFSEEIRLRLINGIQNCCQENTAWSQTQYSNSACGQENTIEYYRLHGCVCWFYHGLGDENIYFHRKDTSQVKIDNLYAVYPGREAFRGINPHAYGFSRFYKMLHQCRVAVFVGFSFRDDDIKHILLNANVNRVKPINLLVVDPAFSEHDIYGNLRETCKGTQFPTRLPSLDEIKCLTRYFADEGFNEAFFDILDNMMR